MRYPDFFGHSGLVDFTSWRTYDTLKHIHTGASGRSGKTGPDTRPYAGRGLAPDYSQGHTGQLGGCCKAQHVAQGSPWKPVVPELEAEVNKLRKERAEVRMERNIVKNAAAYFARESLPGTRS